MPRPARGAEVAHADDEVPQQRPSQLGQERVRRAARGALRRVRAAAHEAQIEHVPRADVVRGCARWKLGAAMIVHKLRRRRRQHQTPRSAGRWAGPAGARRISTRTQRVEGGQCVPGSSSVAATARSSRFTSSTNCRVFGRVASASACHGWPRRPRRDEAAELDDLRLVAGKRGAARVVGHRQLLDDVAHGRRQVERDGVAVLGLRIFAKRAFAAASGSLSRRSTSCLACVRSAFLL